ncbi:MAG: cell division protein SepF [Aristaeellaceae bacterium]
MSFLDSMQALLDKVKQRTAAGEEQQTVSNMANGGYSGYKPATSRHRAARGGDRRAETQQEAGQSAGEQAQQSSTGASQQFWPPVQSGGGYQQSASYQGTGFQPNGGYQQSTSYQGTGFQPNGGYQQSASYQGTGFQPNGGYQQSASYQGTGFQPNGGYQQSASYPGPGFQANGGYQQAWPQGNEQNQGTYAQGASWGANDAQPVPPNLTYLNQDFRGADGRSYRHVERVVQVSQLASCYWLIELMRNKESIIVNTEQVSDPVELDHCMDFLYGATCALGCTLTRISMQQKIYLISPDTVMVVPFDDIRDLTAREIDRRWPEPGARGSRYDEAQSQDAASRRRYGRRSYAEEDSNLSSFYGRRRGTV